jgi:hypothetical protein
VPFKSSRSASAFGQDTSPTAPPFYLAAHITFVEEAHRYPGNYRKQRHQKHNFKLSIAIIRRKSKCLSMKSTWLRS